MSELRAAIIIIFLMFGCGIVLSGVFLLPEHMSHSELISENTTIFSLHDVNSASGLFLLGCGQIQGEMRYTLYIEEDNNGMKLKQIPVDNTIIYEDTKRNPYLTESNLWIVAPSGVFLRRDSWWEYPCYELHVPPGTVIQQYSLDGV